MTMAICLRCGARKHGAWTPCLKCGFAPKESEDLAKSVLLSDQCLEQAALEDMEQRIKAGEAIGFPPGAVESWKTLIDMDPNLSKMPIGCSLIAWSLVGLMLLLAGAVIILLILPGIL
jgi:hypothetical protein